jgi:hypothetical protein
MENALAGWVVVLPGRRQPKALNPGFLAFAQAFRERFQVLLAAASDQV